MNPATINPIALVQAAQEAVGNCFADMEGVSVKWQAPRKLVSGDLRPDMQGVLRVRNRTRPLVVEVKGNGQPRFASNAVNVLLRLRDAMPRAYGIFVAPFISPASANILKDAGLGFVDFAGNCLIRFDDILIQREGRENRFTRNQDLRSLYSPKAERVLRVLIAAPKQVWKMAPLAKEAGVSLGQVANVKKLLEGREWIKRDKGGISLSEPKLLLAEWSAAYRRRDVKAIECYALDSLAEMEQRIAGGQAPGYLTAFSAAARMAPMVRYQRVTAYIREPVEQVITRLKLKQVPSGGNLILLEPYDDGVFQGTQERDGIKFVSALQTYLDLQTLEGRGEEAAEAVLRETLEPLW